MNGLVFPVCRSVLNSLHIETMAVNPSLTTALQAGIPYFRFTSSSFLTPNPATHVNVVDGQGAKKNPLGGRYSPPIVETVYLTEDIETCIAEKMFYFHREIVQSIDELHLPKSLLPQFNKTCVLWEVEFQTSVYNLADISKSYSYFGVFPFLTLNPSQDMLVNFHMHGRTSPNQRKLRRSAGQ
jgi:hypothetical protein